MPQNFSFLGVRLLKFRSTSFVPPKGTSLRGTTRFWALTGPDLTHSVICGLDKENKNRKKDSGKLAIRPDHHVAVSKSKFACRVASSVQFYKSRFIKISSVVLRLEWSKIALPHYIGHWLIQQLVTSVEAVTTRDSVAANRWRSASCNSPTGQAHVHYVNLHCIHTRKMPHKRRLVCSRQQCTLMYHC